MKICEYRHALHMLWRVIPRDDILRIFIQLTSSFPLLVEVIARPCLETTIDVFNNSKTGMQRSSLKLYDQGSP